MSTSAPELSPEALAHVGLRPVLLSDDGRALRLLDQRELPARETWLTLTAVEEVAEAIERMAVRGAPAIGCAAAMGLAAAAHGFPEDPDAFRRACLAAIDRLAHTRPTAVNLFVALEQMRQALDGLAPGADVATARAALESTARRHARADIAACLAMGEHGAPLLPEGGTILTHCNTGALATAGWGTALGVIRRAHAMGRRIRVLVDETRPVLQGARLTAWELVHDGIPAEVIADNMAGALMARGLVQAAIVGADRIARNGDVANKIGTYTVAVLCRHHGVPFYVAAPWTTIDLELGSGAEIPIEERDESEIHVHGDRRMTPIGVGARNPAFDVTPAALITKIITERGVHEPSALAELA
ncbi:MAG: S-methyl-5-thioribose-1-phosphate isomerase [Myxococcales bacterium]|nr:S-methyl-5-thioribose-1-phosphate isomerase [Myxococcales bacterium]